MFRAIALLAVLSVSTPVNASMCASNPNILGINNQTAGQCVTGHPSPIGVQVADQCTQGCGIVYRHCIAVGRDSYECESEYNVCMNDCY
ncbi:hypothetical protein O9X98_14300 [Agrobacterium salinitolerans]|nr:hypothetical protein [Agrobacterium salinitolerans]